jgi:ribosomal protein S18 acetylase RimI-like enzyme
LSNIIVRKFKIRDYDAVIALWEKTHLPYKPKGRDSRKNIEKQIKQANTIYLVAEQNNIIIGAVLGTHDSRKGYINRLAVMPAFQNRGIGRRLVKEIEKHMHKNGIGIITSLVEDWNKTSLKAFQRMGYKKHKDIIYFSKRKSSQI